MSEKIIPVFLKNTESKLEELRKRSINLNLKIILEFSTSFVGFFTQIPDSPEVVFLIPVQIIFLKLSTSLVLAF
jgi:hypothetical protein